MDRERSDQARPEQFIGVLSVKDVSQNLDAPLKGQFKTVKGTMFFEMKGKQSTSPVRLPLWKSSDPAERNRYDPLFAFLEEKEMEVNLRGRFLKRHQVFAVTTVESVEQEFGFPPSSNQYSPGFLQSVVEHLRTRELCAPDTEQKKAKPFFSKTSELKAYYSICKNTFPAWVCRAIERELHRLDAIGIGSEATKHAQKAMRYLLSINWNKQELHVPGVEEAKQILDSTFYGLEEVKSRIMEIVAQINRTGELPLWGILLNGPAGTGKTSIAKAVAALLGMPLIPIDASTLGGTADELSGSSRIYGNAQPGAVLEKMLQTGSSTGLLLINEIDKASTRGHDGEQGTADALLTLLDRQGFYENFLEESIPTDGLFAVATCNEIGKLSAPLRDRFLVINIPGYTPEEKEVIWMDYVLPRVTARLKLRREQIGFTQEAAAELVRSYAVEPGVRDLEQISERFAGVLCTMLDKEGDDYCHTFGLDEVRKLLGPGRRVSRSFAVNPGEINALFSFQGRAGFFLLEAAVAKGTGKFQVLGPVPPVQKQYIQAACECVRNTTPCDLSDKDVTIFVPHVIPEGQENHVGCAAYAAVCSLILQTPLEIQDIAFVGGVDLNGNLYFDEADARPLLRALKEAGIKTLYAPVGVGDMIRRCTDGKDTITVVEAQDAGLLFSMAVTANRMN